MASTDLVSMVLRQWKLCFVGRATHSAKMFVRVKILAGARFLFPWRTLDALSLTALSALVVAKGSNAIRYPLAVAPAQLKVVTSQRRLLGAARKFRIGSGSPNLIVCETVLVYHNAAPTTLRNCAISAIGILLSYATKDALP